MKTHLKQPLVIRPIQKEDFAVAKLDEETLSQVLWKIPLTTFLHILCRLLSLKSVVTANDSNQ